ncbi:MAG: 2-isopropylmalate synthase [Deltaproteobacteria bacterium]|nr:2-isopropylmalate synthase [Deltaproteobacteria bacterium]
MAEAKFAKKYDLIDVSEPNLMRDVFPYDSICKVTFDSKFPPKKPAKKFWITDTTFRDGQQARPPYTVKQIVALYKMLNKLGGPNGIIRQSEFFIYTDKDKKAVEECLELGLEFPEITSWIRAVKEDFRLVKEMGLKETGILTSASDYHIFLKLKKTRKQTMDEYLGVVKAALDAGVTPRCHLEDATRADVYGFCIPFVQELTKLREESGIPIKVRICDTMGYGVPWPDAELPRSVPKWVRAVIDDGGTPEELVEWHGHNDFHKVLVNASCAWLYGCSAANGTLLGIGERTGNPPVEALIIEYISLTGDSNGIDTTVITEIARYYEKEIGYKIPSNYPFVGSDFNVTRAGIHADGIMKNEEIYNIFDTAKILKRPIGVAVTDKSGLAGIAYWFNNYFGLENEKRIDKKYPGLAKIQEWIIEQYSVDRTSAITTEELLEQGCIHLPEYCGKRHVSR